MRAASRLAAALAFCAAGAALAAGPAPDKALHALFEREFQYGSKSFPSVPPSSAEENALYGDLPFDAATPWMNISSMFGPHALMAALAGLRQLREAPRGAARVPGAGHGRHARRDALGLDASRRGDDARARDARYIRGPRHHRHADVAAVHAVSRRHGRGRAQAPGRSRPPRTPYGIRPMEAFEGNNADNYSRPALDGSRAGFFNANVNNLALRPSHEMEAVLLHETVPGHHLQIARAQELPGLPAFRRSGGYVAYSEGWALYAESLGYEMGFYKDPYMRFGALTAEMLRACRLVIDTGLHTKDWGRERSIRYLMENAGLKEGFATAEVDRYITNPGQALGYKIGELRIKALRARAARALGERFDVRRFHNAVLDDGALPLTVLEARIDEWIAQQQGKQ
jgi:hypothetical protein